MAKRKDANGNYLNRNNIKFTFHTHWNYNDKIACNIKPSDPKHSKDINQVTCTMCKSLIKQKAQNEENNNRMQRGNH